MGASNANRAGQTWAPGGDRGFSIVEGLVAAAILTTTAVGTVSLATHFVRQSRRAQRLNAAVVMQSAVQNALLTRQQYALTGVTGARLAQIQAIRAGQASAAFDGFQLLATPSGALDAPGVYTVAAINRRTYHRSSDPTDHYGTCAGPTLECDTYVDLDMDCTTLSTRGCIAAYRIGLESDVNSPAPAALGAPLRAAGAGLKNTNLRFAADDYDFMLSHDLFTLMDTSNSGLTCNDPTRDVMITGVNRETGAVTCLAYPSLTCMDVASGVPGAIGHGIKAVNGHLEMSCHTLDAVTCPNDYVFQKFDVLQLDRGSAEQQSPTSGTLPLTAPVHGTCVYRWRTHIGWQAPLTPTSGSATFTVSTLVCNSSIYDAVGDKDGCKAQKSNVSAGCCPSVTGGCSSRPNSDVTASGSTNGGTASCTVTITDQCGSSVTATPTWGGTCEVKERLINPGLIKPPVGGVF